MARRGQGFTTQRAPPGDPAAPSSSGSWGVPDDYCALPEALPVIEPARSPEAEPPAPLAMPEAVPPALPAALPAAPCAVLAVDETRLRAFVAVVLAALP